MTYPLRTIVLLVCAWIIPLTCVADPMPGNYPSLDATNHTVPTAAVGNFDDDDEREVMLENRFVRLVFEPDHGATVSSFYHKAAGLELTLRAAKGTWGGMFRDQIWQGPGKMDLHQAVYDVAVDDSSPASRSVTFTARLFTGVMAHVTVAKTFTVTDADSRVRVDYSQRLDSQAPSPARFAFWHHNTLGLAGRDGWLFWAGKQGVYRRAAPSPDDIMFLDPTRGWLGYVDQHGAGLAFVTRYSRMERIFSWNGRSGSVQPRGTLEWMINQYELKPGDSMSSTHWIVPFRGIAEPDGAGAAGVSELEVPALADGVESRIVGRCAAAMTGRATAQLRVQLRPGGAWRTIMQRDVQLTAGHTVELAADFTPTAQGLYVFQMRLLDGEVLLSEAEQAQALGRTRVPYSMEPGEARDAPFSEPREVELNFTSTEVVTPHVAWANPRAGEAVRFLLLTDGRHSREAVELAQRFDLKPHSTYVSAGLGDPKYDIDRYDGKLNVIDLLDALERTFVAQADADVIVMSGAMLQWFTPWMKGELVSRVREGTGLVWLGDAVPEAAELLPVPQPWPGQAHADGPLHPVIRGIPLAVAHPDHQWLAADGGATIAYWRGERASEHRPLVTVGQAGEGRVVVLGYPTYVGPYGGHSLTPARAPMTDYHAHEYQLGLLGRAILWAAKREATSRIEQVIVADDNRSASVVLGGPVAEGLKLHVTSRDAFHRTVAEQTLDVAGDRLTVALPVLRHGLNLVDVRLVGTAGTLDWHSVAVHVTHPVFVQSVAPDKDVFQQGEPVSLTAVLAGAAAEGQAVRFRLVDRFDRVVWEQRASADAAPLAATASLARPSSIRLTGWAELLDAQGDVLAAARTHVDYHHVPDDSDFTMFFDWPAFAPGGWAHYLARPFYERLAELGATGWHVRQGTNHADEVDGIRHAGLHAMLGDGGARMGKHAIAAKTRQDFEATKDKFTLVRTPCLSDPAMIEQKKQAITRNAAHWSCRWGVQFFMLGDENNYTSNADICFSKHCLGSMRQWLRRKYGSLESLNAEWMTDFASWDAVVPMIRQEVQGRASWAPWLDHRLFGDELYADTWRTMRRHLEAIQPGSKLGGVGTYTTDFHRGWDWQHLRTAITANSPYAGEHLWVIRSLMRDVPQYPAGGYSTSETQFRLWLMQSMFMGSTRGVEIFAGSNSMNPDFSVYTQGSGIRKVTGEINRGLARMLFQATPLLDPVKFHYSPRSIWAGMLVGDDRRVASRNGFKQYLTDLGLQYGYVSYTELENDGWDNNTRLLFLNLSMAMSDAEVAQVKKFVHNGGVVIADLLPAVMTANGRWRPTSALDEVFGVEHADVRLVRGEGTVRWDDGEVDIRSAAAVRLAGAKALGQWTIGDRSGPAMVTHRYGKGTAVYLACDMMAGLQTGGAAQTLGQAIGASMADAELKPAARITDTAGVEVPAELYRFSAGELQLLGVIHEREPVDAIVHLPSIGYTREAYNDGARSAGPVARMPIRLGDPHGVALFATLPYAVTGVRVAVAPEAQRGQSLPFSVAIEAEHDTHRE